MAKLKWERANPYGIEIDATKNAWHGGRVNDVLVNYVGTIIAAASKGGVWLIAGNGACIPLSESWENPDVLCLALGPGKNHIYAGCSMTSPYTLPVLYETDDSKSTPLAHSWKVV